MPEVLIIDDNKPLRWLLRTALEEAGHQVAEAPDGVKGVRAYLERRADVVLCDIFMPEMEGLETIRTLRRHDPGVRIIAMSGGSGTVPVNGLQIASHFGAVRVLSKPFPLARLIQVVQEILAHR
jgi:CheY-like chemotaxis protein